MTAPNTARAPALRHPLLVELHAAADDLIAAVHGCSKVGVEHALDRARRDAGDHPDPMVALAVLLAAAVADDAAVAEHVAWVAQPSRYLRLRRTGMTPATACALIADDLHRQEPPCA